MKTVIIYHSFGENKPCPDGIAAAYFASKVYPNAELIGCNYPPANQPFKGLPDLHHSNVIIVDFSILPIVWSQWKTNDCQITIIDHHQSAINQLASIENQIKGKLDIAKCGAMLTFEYFFPNQPIPDFLYLINERDCGKIYGLSQDEYWEGDATLFHHWCGKKGRTFELMSLLESKSHSEIIEIIQEIKPALVEKRAKCTNYLRKVEIVEWEGYKCAKARLDSPIMTDLGKMIVDVLDVDIAMMLYEDKVHLRSSVNENVNVGTLALKHGGGGHKHAAGYAIK